MSVLLLRLAVPLQSWGASSARLPVAPHRKLPHQEWSGPGSGPPRRATASAGKTSATWPPFPFRCTRGPARYAAPRLPGRIPVRQWRSRTRVETFRHGRPVFVAAVEADDTFDLTLILHRSTGTRWVFLPYLGRRPCPPVRAGSSLGVRRGHNAAGQALTAGTVARRCVLLSATPNARRRRPGSKSLWRRTAEDVARRQPGRPAVHFGPLHRQYRLRGVHRPPRVDVANPAARPFHDPMAPLGSASCS